MKIFVPIILVPDLVEELNIDEKGTGLDMDWQKRQELEDALDRQQKLAEDLDKVAQRMDENIKKVECIDYPELGMEAVWKIEVEDFPAFILVDDKGNDFFSGLM